MSLTDKIRDLEKRLDLYSILSRYHLEPADKGNYYVVKCPVCGHKEAYIYKPEFSTSERLFIKCNREKKCGEVTGIFDLILQEEGLTPLEGYKFLAELVGVEPELSENTEREFKKREIIKEAYEFFKESLFSREGQETLEYLKDKRGYTEEEIKRAGLGHYPGRDRLFKYLSGKGYSKEEVNEFYYTITHFEGTHTLILPYYDGGGILTGFIARSQLPEDKLKEKNKKKYLVSRGTERGKVFYNIHRWRPETPEKKRLPLIVVEGYIDALIGAVRGISGIVAVGGAKITENQIKDAIARGFKQFILALDNDQSFKDMRQNIERVLKAGGKVYVFPEYEEKDPDELMRAKGVEAFLSLVESPLDVGAWYGKRIAREFDFNNPVERDQGLEFTAKVAESPLITSIEASNLLQVLSGELDKDEEDLLEDLSIWKEKEKERVARESLKSEILELTRDIEKKEIEEITEGLKGIIERIEIIENKEPWPSYGSEEVKSETDIIGQGYNTGIPGLDVLIPPGALTIIAGRPGHGKTTLILNLILGILREYPEKRVILFSYEQARWELYLRLLIILTGEILKSKANNVDLYLRIVRGTYSEDIADRETIEKVRKNINLLDVLMKKEKRLILYDKPFSPQQLRGKIINFRREFGEEAGPVFIDYLQRVVVGGGENRYAVVKEISNTLSNTAIETGLPVIAGAQLNREAEKKDCKGLKDCTNKRLTLAHLRESGDIEQDANLVMGIFNPLMVVDDAESQIKLTGEAKVGIRILKNRNSQAGNYYELSWIPEVMRIGWGRKRIL